MSSSGFLALTVQFERYLIKSKNGSSLHLNRYCLYTLFSAGFFIFSGLINS